MKLLILYRPDSEYARGVDSFIRDLQQAHNLSEHALRVINYDSQEGTEVASAYGLVAQPAMVVVDGDGGYVKHWEGTDLPLQDEVIGYLYTTSSA